MPQDKKSIQDFQKQVELATVFDDKSASGKRTFGERFVDFLPSKHKDPKRRTEQERGMKNLIDFLIPQTKTDIATELLTLPLIQGKVLWRGIRPWVRGMVKDGRFVGGGVSTKFPQSKSANPLYTSEHKGIAEHYARSIFGDTGYLMKFDVPRSYISKHGTYVGHGAGEVRFDSGIPKEFLEKVEKITPRSTVVFDGKGYKIIRK